MVSLYKNQINSIWHAFQALNPEDNLVTKSKLKVLTANIGKVLDLYEVEKGLDHYRSTKTLSFSHYKYYLLKEVFSCCAKDMPMSVVKDYEYKIDDICWEICKRPFLVEHPASPTYQRCYFQWFRIFCMLADFVQTEENIAVIMHPSEVANMLSQFLSSLGMEWDENSFLAANEEKVGYDFMQLLHLLRNDYFKSVDAAALLEATEAVSQIFTQDVLKKGVMLKKGYLLPTLREYWFVLKPTQLVYYKNRSEKDQCGVIQLNPRCWLSANLQRIVLHTNERVFELAPLNHRSRLQWISALRLAIKHSVGCLGYQRTLAARRRLHREAGTARRNSLIKELGMQLQQERTARVAAEEKVKLVWENTEKHVEELEAQLHEEQQAKRDEEIVRNLQARILQEEWEKKEELERLQEEQRILLLQEREKRLEFETKQKEKESQLLEAERRLIELEAEREKLDAELKNARMRLSVLSVTPAATNRNSTKDGTQRRMRRAVSMLPQSS